MVSKQELKFYGKNRKILIVDSDEKVRNLIKNEFKDYINLALAIDGQDVLDKYKKYNGFDIVITELNLQKIDGLKFIKEIKNIKEDQAIIVISASKDAQVLIDLISIGVDRFILKPILPAILAQKLLNTLENLSFKEVIEDMKRDEIIKTFEEKHNVTNLQNKILQKEILYIKHQKIAQVKNLSQEPKIIIENKVVKDEADIKTAIDFFNFYEDKSEEIIIIINKIELLENEINQLILFTQYIEMRVDYSEAIDLMFNISEAFQNVATSMKEFKVLKDISKVFIEFHDFFSAYNDFDDLSEKAINELLSVEFIFQDIKAFCEQLFISKISNDIFIYEKLFLQNLEQLEVNIQNADKEAEDSHDDNSELDFF